MKKTLLCIFKACLVFCLVTGILTFSTPIQAATQNECWCCIDGTVMQISAEECKAKGGRCYPTKYEAEKNCGNDNLCWCCVDGKVVQMTPEECKEKGGRCFTTKYEAEKNCRDDNLCWCCVDGKVVQLTPEQCKEKGGQCYPTKYEAEKNCREPLCWCCIDGKVVQIKAKDCKEKGGRCYRTKDEAAKNCRQPEGRVCCVAGRYNGISIEDADCGGTTSKFILVLNQPNCGKKVTGKVLDPVTGAATSNLVGKITPTGRGCCKFKGRATGIPGTNDAGCVNKIKATFCLKDGKWVVRDGTFSIISGDCCSGGTFKLRQI